MRARLARLGARLPSAVRLMTANIAVTAVTFLTGIITARMLLPEGRGQFAALTVWVMAISHVGMLGIHQFLARESGREPQRAGAIYAFGSRILAVIVPVLTLGYFAGAYFVTRSDPTYTMLLVLVSALVIPGTVANALQLYMELAQRSFALYNFGRLAFAVLFFAFSCILVVAGSRSVLDFLIAFAVAMTLTPLLTGLLISRRLAGRPRAPFAMGWRSAMIAASPYSAAISVGALTLHGDKLLLSVLFPEAVLGLFVVASSVAQVQHTIGEALAQLFFARLASLGPRDEIDGAWLAQKLRQSVLVYLAVATGALIALPPIFPLVYGEAYRPGVTALVILIPAIAIQAMVRPYEETFRGLGRPKVSLVILACGNLVMIGLLALVAWLGGGLREAALCVLAGNAVSLAVALYHGTRLAGQPVTALLVPRPSDAMQMASRIRQIF